MLCRAWGSDPEGNSFREHHFSLLRSVRSVLGGLRDYCARSRLPPPSRWMIPHAKLTATTTPPAASWLPSYHLAGAGAPVAPMCANGGQFWRANCRQHGLVFLWGNRLARCASWGVMGHCQIGRAHV